MSVNSGHNKHNLSEYISSDILLPCVWEIYLYNKSAFKKMANKSNYMGKPYVKVVSLKTLNDLIYFIQLMKVPVSENIKIQPDKINLDMNDYIIMREGIEPIWEDPKNSDGGTFSIRVPHNEGYDLWVDIMIRMIGETLTYDMQYINGISITYISDYNYSGGNTLGECYTLLKIWDGQEKKSRNEFLAILPSDIRKKIGSYSIMYSAYKTKKHYGQENIINKLNTCSNRGRERGRGRGRGRGGGFRKPSKY